MTVRTGHSCRWPPWTVGPWRCGRLLRPAMALVWAVLRASGGLLLERACPPQSGAGWPDRCNWTRSICWSLLRRWRSKPASC